MEFNHQAIVTELWGKIRNAIDGKIASASGHLAEVIQVADQKIAEAARHAADALEAKERAEEAGGDKANVDHQHESKDIVDATSTAGHVDDSNKVLKADSGGRFYYSRDSTDPDEVVNLRKLQAEIESNVPDIPEDAIPWIGTRSEYNALGTYYDKLYIIVTG